MNESVGWRTQIWFEHKLAKVTVTLVEEDENHRVLYTEKANVELQGYFTPIGVSKALTNVEERLKELIHTAICSQMEIGQQASAVFKELISLNRKWAERTPG